MRSRRQRSRRSSEKSSKKASARSTWNGCRQATGRRATGWPMAQLPAARAGLDVRRLRDDVERLLLYALQQKRITVDDVREVAGPAGLQDDWAMTNAIEAGQGGEALRQLALMLDAGAAPEKI